MRQAALAGRARADGEFFSLWKVLQVARYAVVVPAAAAARNGWPAPAS